MMTRRPTGVCSGSSPSVDVPDGPFNWTDSTGVGPVFYWQITLEPNTETASEDDMIIGEPSRNFYPGLGAIGEEGVVSREWT